MKIKASDETVERSKEYKQLQSALRSLALNVGQAEMSFWESVRKDLEASTSENPGKAIYIHKTDEIMIADK